MLKNRISLAIFALVIATNSFLIVNWKSKLRYQRENSAILSEDLVVVGDFEGLSPYGELKIAGHPRAIPLLRARVRDHAGATALLDQSEILCRLYVINLSVSSGLFDCTVTEGIDGAATKNVSDILIEQGYAYRRR